MTTLATIPVPGTDRQIMATLVGGKVLDERGIKTPAA